MKSRKLNTAFILFLTVLIPAPARPSTSKTSASIILLAASGALGYAAKKAYNQFEKATSATEKGRALRHLLGASLGALGAGAGALYAARHHENGSAEKEKKATQTVLSAHNQLSSTKTRQKGPRKRKAAPPHIDAHQVEQNTIPDAAVPAMPFMLEPPLQEPQDNEQPDANTHWNNPSSSPELIHQATDQVEDILSAPPLSSFVSEPRNDTPAADEALASLIFNETPEAAEPLSDQSASAHIPTGFPHSPTPPTMGSLLQEPQDNEQPDADARRDKPSSSPELIHQATGQVEDTLSAPPLSSFVSEPRNDTPAADEALASLIFNETPEAADPLSDQPTSAQIIDDHIRSAGSPRLTDTTPVGVPIQSNPTLSDGAQEESPAASRPDAAAKELSEKNSARWAQLMEKISAHQTPAGRRPRYDGSIIPLRFLKIVGGNLVHPEGADPFIIDPAEQNQISPYTGRPIPRILVDAARLIQDTCKSARDWPGILGALAPVFTERPAMAGLTSVFIGHGVVVKEGDISSVIRSYKITKYGPEVFRSIKNRGGSAEDSEESFNVTPLYLVCIPNVIRYRWDGTPQGPMYLGLSEKINIGRINRHERGKQLSPYKDHIQAVTASGNVGDLHTDNMSYDPHEKNISFFDLNMTGSAPMGISFLQRTEYPEAFSQLIVHMNAIWAQIALKISNMIECKERIMPFLRKARKNLAEEYPKEVEVLEQQVLGKFTYFFGRDKSDLDRWLAGTTYTTSDLQERFGRIQQEYQLDAQCNFPHEAKTAEGKSEQAEITSRMKALAQRIESMSQVSQRN